MENGLKKVFFFLWGYEFAVFRLSQRIKKEREKNVSTSLVVSWRISSFIEIFKMKIWNGDSRDALECRYFIEWGFFGNLKAELYEKFVKKIIEIFLGNFYGIYWCNFDKSRQEGLNFLKIVEN